MAHASAIIPFEHWDVTLWRCIRGWDAHDDREPRPWLQPPNPRCHLVSPLPVWSTYVPRDVGYCKQEKVVWENRLGHFTITVVEYFGC